MNNQPDLAIAKSIVPARNRRQQQQERQRQRNNMSLLGTIEKKITDTTGAIKKDVAEELLLSDEIKKNINLLALTLRTVLENKDVRNEIIGVAKSVTDISKKSIEETRDYILKDKVFLDNLTNTSKKIGDQVSTAVYSTIDGLTLGTVSDVRAVYSSFLASLNVVDLLSSILKVPVSKLDEKLKSDSKEVVSLFQSIKSIKNTYDDTMKKLNDEMNNKTIKTNKTIKLIKKTVPTPLLSAPSLPPSVPLIKSVGGSYKKNKTKKTITRTKKRIRNRTRRRTMKR